jgi:hypothetical protein
MDELSLASQEKISTNELSLATKLIEGMADKFDPAKGHSRSRRLAVGGGPCAAGLNAPAESPKRRPARPL